MRTCMWENVPDAGVLGVTSPLSQWRRKYSWCWRISPSFLENNLYYGSRVVDPYHFKNKINSFSMLYDQTNSFSNIENPYFFSK